MTDLLYKILRPLIKVYVKICYKPSYKGLENIPKKGRIVLAGNHTSIMDCILLISSTKRTIHFLAKDSLVKGFKKIIFKNMGIIPVNRNIHDKNALKSAINILKKDEVIGIFPEGTINKTNDTIMNFKIGAVKMAYESDSYIIPFTIKGKYKLFKKGITIEFMKKIKPINSDLSIDNKKLMKIISNNLERSK